MAVVAKLPNVNPNRSEAPYAPRPRNLWQRWNKQMSLVVFIIGIGALWLAVSLLLVIEIQ